jgi:hypothetical protein
MSPVAVLPSAKVKISCDIVRVLSMHNVAVWLSEGSANWQFQSDVFITKAVFSWRHTNWKLLTVNHLQLIKAANRSPCVFGDRFSAFFCGLFYVIAHE